MKTTQETIESTVLAYIGEAVDKKIFIRCPYADVQLSYASPYVLVKEPNNMNALQSIVAPTTPDLSTGSQNLNLDKIVNISDIEKSWRNSPPLRYVASTAVPPKPNVKKTNVTMANVKKSNVPATKVQTSNPQSSNTQTPNLVISSVMSNSNPQMSNTQTPNLVISSVVGGVPFSPPIEAKKPITWADTVAPRMSTDKPKWDSLLIEIDRAAYSLVKGTGLEGTDLYRCAVPQCQGTGTGPMNFNVHMMKHTTPEDQQNGYKCYHCPLLSKNIIGLKYHIKEHGVHRYFCYYCNHTGPIMNDLLKHMEDTHKKLTLVTFPLNPKRTDQNKDMFVICPRGLRQEELDRFALRLIERYKHTVTVNKKTFSPDEIDMIPMQAIMPNLISCANCAYSTKVRTNMIRHLTSCTQQQAGTNATVQPHSDPVNPVPCLDSGELHFDKMRNLAGSSHSNNDEICAFIPEIKRYCY